MVILETTYSAVGDWRPKPIHAGTRMIMRKCVRIFDIGRRSEFAVNKHY